MFTTFERQKELVEMKLASRKTDPTGRYTLFKYAPKVMYNNLWNTPGVMECRGHVYDNFTGEVVVAAPRKSFNHTQENWWGDVQPDELVFVFKKYNGFLLNVSKHNDLILYTTTGSFDSDYVKMGIELYTKLKHHVINGHTHSYEIIHQDDPHIVDEGEPRAIYLGARHKASGIWHPTSPEHNIGVLQWKDAQKLAEDDKGEGFMVYHVSDDKMLSPAKLKTPYYVTKKKLMRLTAKSGVALFDDPSVLPSMYLENVKDLINQYTLEDWVAIEEQERRKILETSFGF